MVQIYKRFNCHRLSYKEVDHVIQVKRRWLSNFIKNLCSNSSNELFSNFISKFLTSHLFQLTLIFKRVRHNTLEIGTEWRLISRKCCYFLQTDRTRTASLAPCDIWYVCKAMSRSSTRRILNEDSSSKSETLKRVQEACKN